MKHVGVLVDCRGKIYIFYSWYLFVFSVKLFTISYIYIYIYIYKYYKD